MPPSTPDQPTDATSTPNMPEHRGICLSLQSQYDALRIPEIPVPFPPSSLTEDSSSEEAVDAPESNSIVETYIPAYPGSQFWIVFRCTQPPEPDMKFYYFKLLMDGECILSWGCGEKDEWRGRVGYGIFQSSGEDLTGRPLVEKRAFVFPNLEEGGAGGSFEIQVFRAKARKKDYQALAEWHRPDSHGLRMNIAGYLKQNERRRQYAYALLDPLHAPYASFVYHYHTGKQLRESGLDMPDGFDIDNIVRASPSKRSVNTFAPASPPPKIRPASPPSTHRGKDSIALRRRQQSAPVHPGFDNGWQSRQASPTRVQRELDVPDSFAGLTLAEPAASTSRIPRMNSSSGLVRSMAGRWKRRIRGRDGEVTSVMRNDQCTNPRAY